MGEFKASRRRVLQGLGASAAFAAASSRLGTAWADQAMLRAAGVLAPGSRPDLSKPVGTDLIPQVDHIIIYMQENRSFDHYFGMLGRGDGFTLAGGVPTNANPDLRENPVVVRHSNEYCQHTKVASQSWNASHI